MESNKKKAIVQVFEGTSNSDNKYCHSEFTGSGKPLDKGPAVLAEEYLDINGASLNPKSHVATNSASQVGSTTENNFSDTIKGNIKAASSRRLPDLHQHSGNNFDAKVDVEAAHSNRLPYHEEARDEPVEYFNDSDWDFDPAYLGTILHQGRAGKINGLGIGLQSAERLYRVSLGSSDHVLVTPEYVSANLIKNKRHQHTKE